MAHPHRLSRRAAVWLVGLAALLASSFPLTSTADAQAADGCRRYAHASGYDAVVVVVGGGGCSTVVTFRCRNDRRRMWLITSWQPFDVRTIKCQYPFRFVRVRPLR